MPEFGSNVSPILPQNERYAQFKKQQEAVMQQHAQYAQALEQKQQQLEVRKGDVDIAGRLMKILDSRLPKPARQFLAKELAQHVGADPKTEQVKGVSQMLTSMDPDSLQGLRSGLAANLDGAEPGQIAQTVQGILTGKMPMDKFIEQVGPAMAAGGSEQVSGGAGEEQLTGGEGGDTLGGGEAKTEDRLTQDQSMAGPTSPAPAPFQPGAEGEIRSLEGQRTVSPVDQPASANIVGALGFDSTKLYRNRDLIQGGVKIPFDAKDQDKLAEEINTRATGMSATISEASKMVDIFEGHPETLGTVGGAVQTIESIVQQARGALNVINPAIVNETDPYSSSVQSLSNAAGKQLAKIHGIEVTATNAAQLQSMALGLAYKMAIANDIPGNRLTNVIIEQNLRQIGQSGSPKQFKAVLANTIESTTREFNESVRRKTGINGTDILARQMSQADLDAYAVRAETDAKNPDGITLIPREMRQSLLNEAIARKEGRSTGPQISPSSPTIEEEQKTLGAAEMQRKGQIRDRESQTMRLEQERADRAVRTEERQDTREERMTRSQEAGAQLQREQFQATEANRQRDEAFQRETFEHTKGEQARDNAFQREQFDYRKQQDLKAADLARQEKIAAAFRHFGAAISGRGGGGGSVGVPNLGGGQDISAFRMTPAPQRIPPKPGGR